MIKILFVLAVVSLFISFMVARYGNLQTSKQLQIAGGGIFFGALLSIITGLLLLLF